jgi:hypothetical protein
MKFVAVAASLAAFAVCGAAAEDDRAEAERIAQEIVDLHPRGAEIGGLKEFAAAKAALLEAAADTDFRITRSRSGGCSMRRTTATPRSFPSIRTSLFIRIAIL